MDLIIKDILLEKNNKTILNIENLNLGTKGMVALIGPNGAGKSSLLKIIAGLTLPSQGKINFQRKNLLNTNLKERARKIGYIPQQFEPVWNQKAAELLELAVERTKKPSFFFEKSVNEFELQELLNRPWDALSGGERGRLMIAMAMAGNPPLILADEPGSALDISHHLKMLDIFKEKSLNCLIVVCLHDLNLCFQYFERVVFLKEGKLIFSGPSEQLLHSRLLDKGFNVNFQRVKTKNSWLLQPETKN